MSLIYCPARMPLRFSGLEEDVAELLWMGSAELNQASREVAKRRSFGAKDVQRQSCVEVLNQQPDRLAAQARQEYAICQENAGRSRRAYSRSL